MKALHVITCKYVGPRGLRGSKMILKSDRFRQSKWIAYDSSKRDALHQGWDYLQAQGFEPIGTGEGKDHMYIVCNVLKPLK
jgi:hypothetical protein